MKNDIFKLTIPSKPDYISVARLTSSAIANKIGFNIDDIEDIKVSIAEACINSLSRSECINIEFEIRDDKFIMRVENVSADYQEEDINKEMELGILIIKSLMDEVNFSEKGVEMIKFIEDGSI
ncbi:ATP-binding protein [Tepidimicrobium xylanilyticum]|uniref:Serine/threonine-protein kinase RsbW n=1 Tax=Tepidimicrobium xylanilyticum TaxID=1123352 RepID=A0A1H3AHL6_9FIRM|nr:ATP-binding protein [Tepidimicrobium xylanilyticum]GMG98137.1 histidine kinase [Tepidimicrobium xylanilyticum]SDX28951.1 serine/threonine-protein kinase RsbW [Tepidimicrobium xylanilyticum]